MSPFQINVPRPEHAKYVESHISYNDMKAFVCKEGEDVSMFLELTRDEMNLAVNAVRVPPDRNPDFRPKYNLEQLGWVEHDISRFNETLKTVWNKSN